MISSSCGWKSKDLAVSQSHEASRQGRVRESLPSSNVLIYLQQSVWPILKVCASMPLIPNDLEIGDLLVLATMLQGLQAKIQVRNLYL